MTKTDCVMTIVRSDGSSRFELYRHANGFFSFREYSWKNDGYGDHSPQWESDVSGLYGSQEDALNDAMLAFSWLKTEISK
jgi:hypothetical protein